MEATGAGRTDALPSIRVFGGVGIDAADGPVSIGGARLQRLLALLAIRHAQVVTIDWLAEYLWNDDERSDAYATRLRTYVGRLRQALPEAAEGWIKTEPGGYRLVAPPEAIEHVRFASLRARARLARDDGDPRTARDLLDEALTLWRGEPFRELHDADGTRADIEQLHLDRLEMLEERWETELELGRHTQITGELGSFTVEQPLRERAVRQYALALHRSGRTAEGLRALSTFRRTLADETGLDPSPALVDLERSLLDGDPSLDAPVGRPLRGYRLVEEVGTGAFAVVWRATQPSVERDVAIKQVRPELATRPEFIRRFEAEARLVARLEHPHIVPLIDFWRDPDSAYLVMRWLDGDTLQRRIDDGPLSVGEVVALGEEIGGALSVAHGHGVVHRDVKPSNILFDGTGHAYLTDFGIALAETHPDGPEAALSPGSPVYAAPEQLRGEAAGPAADVFGLGAVLHECLVGAPPRRTPDAVETALEPRGYEPFSEARARVDGIPPAIVAAIVRATAAEPTDRFASVAELVRALRSVTTDDESTRSPPRRDPPRNPYVGLRAFDDSDADRFFGRERLVDEIVERLSGSGLRSRCVVVVGPSGSGKSSVTRAGVVPALRRDAAPGSGDWFATTMVPGDDVYGSLEAALLRVAVDPPPTLRTELREGERGVLRGVRRCVADAPLLLVIDQLEELFTTNRPGTTDRFLTALAVAVEDPSSPLRLIATIRADYYDRPLRHPSFARIVKEAGVEITPLAADELVKAIAEPARQVGVAFERGLVARVAADTVGRTSPLPLLQYALSELFDRRSSDRTIVGADYDAVAGIAGALATRAERLYADAEPAERTAIRSVFGRLANPDDTDTRRRVMVADLGDDETVRRVLERLGRARLLTFDRDDASRAPTVEVAHEALLREWPRAETWLEEDRDLRRTVGSIGTAASSWHRGGRSPADLYRGDRLDAAIDVAASSPEWIRPIDREFIEASRDRSEADRRAEQQQIRRLRRLVAGTAVALFAALVAGGFAFTQQQRADREARGARAASADADAQRRAVEEQAARAEAATADAELATILTRSTALAAERPDVALLLALEARRRSPGPATDGAVLDALAAGELGRQVRRIERLPGTDCDPYTPSRRIGPDGLREFAVDGDRLLVKDLITGEIVSRGTAPQRCITWSEDADTGRRWAYADLGDRQWTGEGDSPWARAEVSTRDRLLEDYTTAPGDLPLGGFLHADAVDGRLLYWHIAARLFGPVTPRVVVVDDQSLRPVGDVIADLTLDPASVASARVTAASASGGVFAVAGSPTEPGDENEAGVVVVLDAANGAERFRVRRSARTTAVAFDQAPRTVLTGRADGVVELIDLESREVVGRSKMSVPGPVLAVGARPDGVVAVGRRSIELFDHRGVPQGLPVGIPASETARIRPDGTVLVVPRSDPDTILVIDPTGGPLVEAGWRVDPSGLVAFGAGRAGAVGADGDLELVQLDSGERTPIEPRLPDGERFEAVAALPEDDGFIAWDRDGSVARWRGERVTERLELWSDAGEITLAPSPAATGTHAAAHVGAGVATIFLNGFPQVVHRFDPTPGDLDLTSSIGSPPRAAVAAAPAPDNGFHLVLDDGVVRTYDRTGRSIGEVATGLADPWFAVTDEATGAVAVGGGRGAAVADPSAGTVERIDEVGAVASLGFAHDGTLLVVVETDGTVRLWDVGRTELVGTLWSGGDTAPPSRPSYDATTDSVWVATSGTLLRISLDPERWVEQVCRLVGRELTAEEWDRFVPGDRPRRDVCS